MLITVICLVGTSGRRFLRMRFVGLVYEAHDPNWAWDPLSGEGARIEVGRFNERGVPALYTSLTSEGSWLEATPFGYDLQPRTLCVYEVDVEPIFDATDVETLKSRGLSKYELGNPFWKTDSLSEKVRNIQRIASRLIEDGYAGILVQSYARRAKEGMLNLMLWKWNSELPHKVTPFDDQNILENLKRNPRIDERCVGG